MLKGVPDALTRRPDVYPLGGDSDYASINPQNLRPVFGFEQLAASLRASSLVEVVLDSAYVVDSNSLNSDILKALPKDLDSARLLMLASDSTHPRWSVNDLGFLHLDNRIYVPNIDNL